MLSRIFKPLLVTVTALSLSGYVTFYIGHGNTVGQKEWFFSIIIYIYSFYSVLNGKHNEKEQNGFICMIYGYSIFNLTIFFWQLLGITLGAWIMIEPIIFIGFLIFVIYRFFDRKNKEFADNLHITYLLLKDYLKTLFSR